MHQFIITDDYDQQNEVIIKKVLLEDNLTLDINMYVKYSAEQNNYIPVESKSYLTGFVSGYEWELKSIQARNLDPNKSADFTADGILTWKLFGINIYNETKVFRGVIKEEL
ncbi:hypothetical protein GCM10007389_34910 [Pontibacter akesuensis]|nr:hypothetical protein GCM10007389_34910 [Pontibacter akesuensis]